MFRSFLIGRVNLVRLLQHQHDTSTNTLIQFQPDFGTNNALHNNTITNSTTNSQYNYYSVNAGQSTSSQPTSSRPNNLTDRLLFATFTLKRQVRQNQTRIIYCQRPSDSYIEEVMTIPDNSNSNHNSTAAAAAAATSPTSSSSPFAAGLPLHNPLKSGPFNTNHYKHHGPDSGRTRKISRDHSAEMCMSEGHFRSKWKSHEYFQRTEKKKSTEKGFDFNSLNVTLLETAGTAVAVGIDVRSRTNEYTAPGDGSTNAQARKNYGSLNPSSDMCQGHSHNHSPFGLPLSDAHTHEHEQHDEHGCWIGKNQQSPDPNTMTIVPYCSMCINCNYIYGKLMFSYFLKGIPDISFLPNFASNLLPRLNVFDQKSEKLTLAYNADQTDGPAKQHQQTKSQYQQIQTSEQSKQYVIQSNNKLMFFTEEQYARIQRKIESGDIRKPTSNSQDRHSKKKLQGRQLSDDELDMATVFNKAAADYTNRLNNIIAMDLMQSHRPDEAMTCWLNSEASAKAFFNMGVAFETGKYALNAKPDLDHAHDCYAIAASMGHREAMFNLALYYLYGKGRIKADLTQGMSLLEGAARKGLADAQTFVAELNRRQMLEEVRSKLQRKISTVHNNNNDARRNRTRIYQRSTASMIGARPKKSIVTKETVSTGAMKRVSSAPNLIGLAESKIVRHK